MISGLLCGIAGYCFMMHTGAGNATNAAGMEMNAIASAIIGGTLLTGGVGKCPRFVVYLSRKNGLIWP